MNNNELTIKIQKIKRNLENIKINLRQVDNILESSITFNNEEFKSKDINTINSKLNRQINNINSKIIPEINDM